MSIDGSHVTSSGTWGPYIRRTIVLDAAVEKQLADVAQQRATTPNELITDLIGQFLREPDAFSIPLAGR